MCLVALTTMGGSAEAAKDPATLLLHGPGHNCSITMTATSYADRELKFDCPVALGTICVAHPSKAALQFVNEDGLRCTMAVANQADPLMAVDCPLKFSTTPVSAQGREYAELKFSTNGETCTLAMNDARELISDCPFAGEHKFDHVDAVPAVDAHWTKKGDAITGTGNVDDAGFVDISANGETLAIGAPLSSNANGVNAGSVRVYKWDGAGWNQKGEDIFGEDADDFSGRTVDLSANGDILAIGARDNGGNGAKSGHVRIFSWSGEKWIRFGEDIDGEMNEDFSGESIGLSADGFTVSIGAVGNEAGKGHWTGHVRIFEWHQTDRKWNQKGEDLDGREINDMFGRSVDLSDDGHTLAIGATGGPGVPGNENGRVEIFKWTGVEWKALGQILHGKKRGDRFGRSVDLNADGNVLVVGASWNDGKHGNATNAGHVRVFTFNPVVSRWERKGYDIDGYDLGEKIGSSVDISADGNTVLVASPFTVGHAMPHQQEFNDRLDSAANKGVVRVYNWHGSSAKRGNWVQKGDDIFGEAPGDGQRWQFASLAASGTTVAVGVDSKTQMVPGGSGYAYLVPGKVQVWESACDW
jgi:hypothetical protein